MCIYRFTYIYIYVYAYIHICLVLKGVGRMSALGTVFVEERNLQAIEERERRTVHTNCKYPEVISFLLRVA